jgi:hypothetical protein
MGFTANKNLEQVARGADVGTWDTPTNSNWGIVDNSLGGIASIPLTNAPVTLSAAQYQCAFITFTGALTGNVTVTFPAVGSFYTIQNLTSNTSAFQVTLTTGGGQNVGTPWGEPCDVFTDGTNVKFRNMGRIGTYWDYSGSSIPAWVSACTIPPYLNCDGTSFSSATYPILYTVLGGTNTLPDARGRTRLSLNQGTARITVGISGLDGDTLLASGGDQSLQSHSHTGNTGGESALHTHSFGVVAAGAAVQGGPNSIPGNGSGTTGTESNSHTHSFVTDGSGSGGSQNIQPSYVGGITMIRSA